LDYRAPLIHLGRGAAGVPFTAVPPETNTKIQLFVQLLIFTNLT
jgi:hypothetical protein